MAKRKRKPLERSGIDPEKAPEKVLKVAPRPQGVTTADEAKIVFRERELRRYIRRSGGFRKNLHRDDIAEAKEMLKTDVNWHKRRDSREKRERTEKDGWDVTMDVKGYDNVDHEENQRSVKPRTVG